MNERINGIAEQATEDILGVKILNKEKFVELLLDEICECLQKESIRHDGYGYNQHGLYQNIREHFGVKK
jgi:hypothetical protein